MARADSPLAGRMIFLVGVPRSGTNWLQRILGSHPDVLCMPSESNLFSHGITPLLERFHHGAATSSTTGRIYMDRVQLMDALRDLCDAVFIGVRDALGSTAERIVERTPDHVSHLGTIGEIYPDAHVVHIIRDGRDVARSLVSQSWGPQSIAEAAGQWRTGIEAARVVAPRLERYLEVRYEQVFADPGAEIRRLFEWLALPFDDAVVDRAVAESGIRFNVDPKAASVGQGKWREGLSAEQVATVVDIAGPLLRELDYEVEESFVTAASSPSSPRRTRPSLRAAARSTARRLRRPLRSDIRNSMRWSQHLADRVLTLIAAHDLAAIDTLLADDVHVTIGSGEHERRERGEPGRELLREALAEDAVLARRQRIGRVHPAFPTSFVMLAYDGENGSSATRVFAVTARGEHVERIAYYRLS